jgi:hypothetical protein
LATMLHVLIHEETWAQPFIGAGLGNPGMAA